MTNPEGRLGRITFTFDDGKLSTHTNVFPLLRGAGLRGQLAVITDSVGQDQQYSWDHVAEMAAAGWEILSHSRTHDFAIMNDEKMRAEVVGSRDLLRARGYPARVFSMPGGPWGDDPQFEPGSPFVALVRRTYAAFTPESSGPHLMKNPVDPYNLGYMCCECYGVAEWEYPLETILQAIDAVAQDGLWVDLVWHDVRGFYVQKLEAVVAHALPLVRSGRLVNVTISEAIGLATNGPRP
ncbi:MAG: polysaccharide deacetylase family protein [Candidatus Coatesbacteria bacterium]